jgi:hypothetical protein
MQHYEAFLSRLDRVKQVKQGSWKACCPAHSDSDPSLSIDVAPDGRLLLKCWAGCANLDIITAVGLDWGALYPDTDKHYHSIAKRNHIVERTTDDYIVDLAQHQKDMTPQRMAEAERAALRGGKSFGWCEFVAGEINK